MITKAEAIKAIDLNAQFVIRGGVVESVSGGITGEQIETKQAELQAEYDSQEYARNRQAEYPTINELVVALWEGVVEERMASVTVLEGLRQAVKAKYPK
jgi:hypothetical protein